MPDRWLMLVLLLLLLHKEVVFDLAYLEIGMCLDCRPPANNVLSEVTAR